MGKTLHLTSENPLIENLSELITFIQDKDPNVDELCQFAVIRTFDFLGGIAMFQASLEADGNLKGLGQFGFPKDAFNKKKINIKDELPHTDALKTNNIVWIAEKSDWYRNYPHLEGYENEFMANTFIAWPISVRGAQMSVLGLSLNRTAAPSPELVSFFETVGGIFALQQSKTSKMQVDELNQEVFEKFTLFTRRQRDVIRLVTDGLTNNQIANELGFSESTIRQETMRIYEILGATGRAEAIEMYQSMKNKNL